MKSFQIKNFRRFLPGMGIKIKGYPESHETTLGIPFKISALFCKSK